MVTQYSFAAVKIEDMYASMKQLSSCSKRSLFHTRAKWTLKVDVRNVCMNERDDCGVQNT